MTTFTVTTEIHAPAERIWAVLLDIERWPEWTATMSRIERLDGAPFAVGSRASVLQPKLRPAIWQVTELDERLRSFTWVTRSPGVVATARHRIDGAEHECRVTLCIEFAGLLAPIAVRLIGSLAREYMGIEARGLRARCEQGEPAPGVPIADQPRM